MRHLHLGPEDARALSDVRAALQAELPRIAETLATRLRAHAVLGEVPALEAGVLAGLEALLNPPAPAPWWDAASTLSPAVLLSAACQVRESLEAHLGSLAESSGAVLRRRLDAELACVLQLRHGQHAREARLASVGEVVAAIGHELRNPLAVLGTSVTVLEARPELTRDERVRRILSGMGEQVRLAGRIVSGLLGLVRDAPIERHEVSLTEVWAESREAVPRPEGVRLHAEGLDGLASVAGDALLLRQVFVNLLENAVAAVGTSGTVTLTASNDGAMVELALEDSGPGVDAALRHRLFEPLVTNKARGTGLGLALVRRLVERHGGQVRYAPRAGAGARFVLRLPAWRGAN
ncbi:GHKL domain-containing protein [Myxococcaceae bacterium JPH2]|nr:GHKL domain-containing protein [Myxococcaceae bacterium JPH2]